MTHLEIATLFIDVILSGALIGLSTGLLIAFFRVR